MEALASATATIAACVTTVSAFFSSTNRWAGAGSAPMARKLPGGAKERRQSNVHEAEVHIDNPPDAVPCALCKLVTCSCQ